MIASCSSKIANRSPMRWERQPVSGVLGVEPAGPQAELDPPAAHLVDLRDGDRQRPGRPERHRRHQRAEPDPLGLDGQASQRRPGIGGAGEPADRSHLQVVVGPEERVETQVLGRFGDPQQRRVVGALLWFGEDPQLHTGILPHPGQPGSAGRRHEDRQALDVMRHRESVETAQLVKLPAVPGRRRRCRGRGWPDRRTHRRRGGGARRTAARSGHGPRRRGAGRVRRSTAPPSPVLCSTSAASPLMHPRPRRPPQVVPGVANGLLVLLDRRSPRRQARRPLPGRPRTGRLRRKGRAPSRRALAAERSRTAVSQRVGCPWMYLPEAGRADPPVPAGRPLPQISPALAPRLTPAPPARRCLAPRQPPPSVRQASCRG